MTKPFPQLVLILGAIFLFCMPVRAEEVVKAVSVPSEISDTDYQDLVRRRQALDETRDMLIDKMATLKTACGSVSSDNIAQVNQCTHDQQDLLSKISAYKRDLAAYEEDIRKAKTASLPVKNPEVDKASVQFMKDRLAVHRSRAKAFASWKLGAFLLDSGQTDLAVRYLKEARQFYADPNSHENDVLNQLIYDPRAQQPSLLLQGMFPAYSSKAEAVLDALDYGNGNWGESVKYLEIAHQAHPNDLNVRDALNYVQGLVTAEPAKKSDH